MTHILDGFPGLGEPNYAQFIGDFLVDGCLGIEESELTVVARQTA